MKNLLFAEIKRLLISPLLAIAVLIIVGINIFEILTSNYGFQISATSFLLTHTTILCIIMSVLIPLHIGQEFEYRTINNKISIGYQRILFYLSELIVALLLAFILLLIDSVIIIIFCKIRHYELYGYVSSLSIFTNFMITFLSLCTTASLYTAIVIITRQRILSIIITLLLSFGLLQIGNLSVSAINQPQYCSYEITDNRETPLPENPLYISGDERTLNNLHIFVSPFAQITYMPFALSETTDIKKENSFFLKNNSYHFEYCIADLIEIMCFSSVGFYFFKRENLK